VSGQVHLYGNLILMAGSQLHFATGWSRLTLGGMNVGANVKLNISFITANLKYMRIETWMNAVYHDYVTVTSPGGAITGTFANMTTHTIFCTRVWKRGVIETSMQVSLRFLIDETPCVPALRNVTIDSICNPTSPNPEPSSNAGVNLTPEEILAGAIVTIVVGCVAIGLLIFAMLWQIPKMRASIQCRCRCGPYRR